MTSARYSRPKRLRIAGAAIAAVALPIALVTNLHGRAAAAESAHKAKHHAAGSISLPLSVDWKFTGDFFGSNPASPVFSEDTAYIVCGNAVYALSTETGGMKWRYPSEPAAVMPKLVVFTPTLSGGMLYISAPDGLYALSAATGAMQWRFNPAGKSQVITSPIVQGDVVYFGAQNGRFYAVNAKTGEAAEGSYKLPNKPAGVDMGGDLTTDPTVSNGEIFYTTANQEVHALNLLSGVQHWTQHITADVATAKPVFYGDGFYLAAGNTFSSWRASNGQARWNISMPTDAAVPPVVDPDGNAYVILSDRSMYAINPRGKSIWKKIPRLDNRTLTQPVLAGKTLIVTTALGGLVAYDTVSGDRLWNYTCEAAAINPNYVPTGTSIAARPVVVGDTLFTLSDDGSLTAFRHDAIDTDPPTIDRMEPENGDYINGRPPVRISAHIMDIGSGLDLSTLIVKLDDQPLARRNPDKVNSGVADNGYVYKVDSSTIEYNTIETETGKSASLADGHHTVTVTVNDWKGNTLNKSWTFSTDDTIKRGPKPTATPPGGFGGKSGGPMPLGGAGGVGGK